MCKLSAINENLIEENDNLKTVLKSLRVNDISIKRRALDLLYLSCTPSTATKIVEELLAYAVGLSSVILLTSCLAPEIFPGLLAYGVSYLFFIFDFKSPPLSPYLGRLG